MTLSIPENFQLNLEIIRHAFCQNLTNLEYDLFIHICRHTRLDPILKQIYPIKRDGKLTTQTSIDGFRLVAERTGRYSPGREATFTYDKDGYLFSATSYVMKMTPDGTWHEVSATAFWKEYVQEFKDKQSGIYSAGKFWKKMPHVMLAKCAESGALRKAFPADLSGLYTKEEMGQAESESDESQIEVIPFVAPVEEKPDMSDLELEGYFIENWPREEVKAREFISEICLKNKWSFRKMIDRIHVNEKNLQATKDNFEAWKMSKAGI
jgi:phage recombination protein Bet